MTPRRRLLFAAMFCLLSALPAASIQQDDPLFDQGFRLSQKLGGSEQVYYLYALCDASTKSKASPETTRKYALALFGLGTTEPEPEFRTVVQKNAVSCLSFADPSAALDLIPKIDFQRPTPGEIRDEDSRYNSAEKTFENLIKVSPSPQVLDKIIATAHYLGQTGQYPYAGIAKVISALQTSFKGALPESFKSQINMLVNDAVESFGNDNSFQNRDPEFLKLLLAINDQAVDTAVEARAATNFALRLIRDHIGFAGSYYSEVHLGSAPGSKAFPFTDYKEALLFQAYPQIRRLNGSFAAQLRQQNPRLDEATDGMIYISGGFFQGDPTSAQATQQRLQWFQQSVLNRIKDRQDCNPQAALNLAKHLTDLNSRIVGFSGPIPALARSNATLARSMYEEQLSQLDSVGDPVGRLQSMIALVPAAYSVGDFKQYDALTRQAFNLGIASVISDTGASRAQTRKGFNELQKLVTFAASRPTDALQASVDNLPEGWLKAYLWLYEAQGHANRNTPPATAVPCPE